jgi:DNA-binding SARP family transcriptional activator
VVSGTDPDHKWIHNGRYRLLGSVEFRTEGGTWHGLPQPKLRALLALLLMRRNQVVPAKEIEDELWPEHRPSSSRKLVQQYVHRLRQQLGGASGVALKTRPSGYQLQVQPGDLDADRFMALVTEGQQRLAAGATEDAAHRLRMALDMWRGGALADVQDVPAGRAQAARLNEARLMATEALVCAELELGHHVAMVPELVELVRMHPLRERFRELLMVALCRAGRRADALAVARDVRRALNQELGIEPGVELRQLVSLILREDGAAAATSLPDWHCHSTARKHDHER